MSNMVNIGSKENPVFVPESALEPDTPKGEEYFQMLASGSVVLPDEVLDALLEKINNENH